MTYVLGLDQALTTGYAVVDGAGGLLGHGIHNFRPERGSSDGILYMAFSKWVERSIRKVLELADDGENLIVVYELAHHRGNAATRTGMAFTTRIMEMVDKVKLDGYDIEYTGVRTNVLKKHMGGHGQASKEDMVAAAGAFTSDDITHDEADAILLAMYGRQNYVN